ncbi:class I tRNA ligase family protein [Candidatus Dojkabacteria bacterium]|uniref:valine--tRNA ligase n=1 Tax=Candidatus Dojkabacteria bacterium TaxID=2099670 RepID=A0A955L9T3_9BACT|nr:class I tRNA ligase family protein [Candidatus Dojkabacteria bacterium]
MKTNRLPDGPYNHKEHEEKILKNWLDKKMYKPEFNPETSEVMSLEEMKKDSRTPWSLICPPPNAYGRPHIGNLSGYAYQDAMARYQRMNGKKVLMIPGKDHAGLEGEGVFVREVLEKKKIRKFDLEREEFYNMMMEFNQENMKKALKDEQEIGLSADFDRNLFTLDERVVDIVLSTFVKMFDDGMIYKGVRIINWDPKARSTLADNQCERLEREGTIYNLRYPLVKHRLWKINFYHEKILNSIRDGSKTVESRVLNPDEPDRFFGDIKAGDDLICFDKNKGNHLHMKVKAVRVYEDSNEFFKREDFSKIYTNKNDVPNSYDEMIEQYEKLADGYGEKLKKNGAIAIELEFPVKPSELQNSEFIEVATTRPETMFGDTAVAVNPSDERYKDLIGKKVIIPLANREIPIITSHRVEKDFGTGALKITPAHALDDYQIMLEWNEQINNIPSSRRVDSTEGGRREVLSSSVLEKIGKIGYINVIGQDIQLHGPVPEKYKGQVYMKVMPEIIKDLEESGALVKTEKLMQNILISERTKAIVEPMMSSQWFVDVERLKEPVIDMVRNVSEDGHPRLRIHPENMEKAFYSWMENLRDWAISRSLWWGYRMPVWYAGEVEERINDEGEIQSVINIDGEWITLDPTNKDHMRVQLEKPEASSWHQDDNVLDTWFSSGQWPFATLTVFGLMDTFYPTDVMETGFDILENWVSRMMMFSHITQDDIPFKDVYLHGLVKGTDGQKMSKSKGNLVNIDEVREQYGTDAVRMVYFYQNSAGSDYAMTFDKLKNFKQFNNKIWNASKFVLMNLEDMKEEDKSVYDLKESDLKIDEVKALYNHVIETKEHITKNIEDFEFGLATSNLYQNFWHEFADIHVEALKPLIYTFKDKETGETISEPKAEEKAEAQKVLLFALKTYLKMLHPFIPFVTETIWSAVPKESGDYESLLYTKW